MNLFADIPCNLPDEAVDVLLQRDDIRIERIVARGHASPPGFWYDQDTHEWVTLLHGNARLRFEDEAEPIALAAGDCVSIQAHRRHRIEWTDPAQVCIWLAVHYP